MPGMRLYSLESSDPRRLGPYRLLRRIATGGMGRIYLARQEAPGTPASTAGPTGTVVDHGLVAVKTLLAEGVVSRPDRERFAREVELAGTVGSAYTAKVLDSHAEAERPWLAIEFIPAPSLAELVAGAGTLSVGAVRWVATGAARALLELHNLGVIHRDVKPLNILLPHDGPRIIDFGISHAHDHTTSTTTIGTFAFTSPEQARGEPSTVASDMYSLGATLFFLAVGRPPYAQTDHSIGLLTLVQRGELDTSGLPRELEPLILPLLEVDPGRRTAPSDVLRDVLADRDQAAADRGLEQWLPEAWAALIEEYREQGRELRDGAVDFDAAEAPTRVEAEGATEGVDEAISEMREELEALRKQRDAWVRAQAEEQAEAEARELARQEEEEGRRREQARKREAERREQERREQERREQERRAREEERRERRRRERERIARDAKAAAKSTRTGTGSTSTPEDPPKDPPKATSTPKSGAAKTPTTNSTFAETWGCGLVVAAILVLGIVSSVPWEGKDDDTAKSSPTSPSTLSTSGDTSGLDGAGTGGSSSSSGGGSDDSEREPEPETSSPEPDLTEDAFKDVSYGDCLDVVDTGYGGLKKYEWSEEEPNTTSCGYGTRVKVAGTSGDCESGTGKATWSYYSASSGERTSLCLTGQYHRGDCLLAKHEGSDVSSIAMLSSPNCTDRKVPSPYNEILVVTDVYQATAGAGTEVCRNGQYDPATYWSTKVDDDATLLCLKAYD